MKNPIIAADDEDDLRSKRKILLRAAGIAMACAAIWFQQWQGLFRWHTPVAHADNGIESACMFKDAFSKPLATHATENVSAFDACDTETKKVVGFDTTEFKQEVAVLTSGFPIEAMSDGISRQDRAVAGFLVGIAKKESDWGKHVPTKDGQDCYNYWGYKGAGSRGSSMGYACFGSPEEAVHVVGDRLSVLVHEKNLDTPSKMLVWKCGSSCAGHSSESVKGWVGTVGMYYQKLYKKK